MTTVYFVRHAQPNTKNHDDLTRELTEQGVADSFRIAAFFQETHIDAVYASPYKRAVDTVAPCAQSKELMIQLRADFRERKISDEWISGFQDYAQRQWADFDYSLPSGESLREVQRRNIAALQDLLTRHPNQSILIGTHGTALSTILQYYRPAFGYAAFQQLQPLMPCIFRLLFDGQTCVDIQHLPFDQPMPAESSPALCSGL